VGGAWSGSASVIRWSAWWRCCSGRWFRIRSRGVGMRTIRAPRAYRTTFRSGMCPPASLAGRPHSESHSHRMPSQRAASECARTTRHQRWTPCGILSPWTSLKSCRLPRGRDGVPAGSRPALRARRNPCWHRRRLGLVLTGQGAHLGTLLPPGRVVATKTKRGRKLKPSGRLSEQATDAPSREQSRDAIVRPPALPSEAFKPDAPRFKPKKRDLLPCRG
jgi:hypothetical protein